MSQYGIKNIDPGFYHDPVAGGPQYQITPDEIDRYEIYQVLKPSVGTAYIGSAAGTAASPTFDIDAAVPDYPRNLLLSPSGTAGTVVITGVDQFGNSITETLSAAGGATDAGTLVFGSVTSVTVSKPAAAGTVHLGVASGTASDSPLLGLPFKIGATSDVKRGLWIDNGTGTFLDVDGSAPTIHVNTDTHSVRVEVSGGIAAADDFIIWAKPTYNANSDTAPQAGI